MGDVAGNTYSAYSVAVDLQGDVVVQSEIHIASTGQPAVMITLLSGNAGYLMNVFTLMGNDEVGYQATNRGNVEVALAKDTIYVATRQCVSYASCNSGIKSLFAVKAPGVEMDYPRGVILGMEARHSVRRYVALGDSFSSGEGVEPFDPYTDTSSDTCHRSAKAYANVLGQDSDLSIQLTGFRACSGAQTDNVINGGQNTDEAAQILALDKSVDLVTISVGGNDVDFKDFVVTCITGSCSDNSAIMDRIHNVLPAKLDAAYAAIKSLVRTDARILVVGYPRIVPHDDGSFLQCALLASDERRAAAEVQSTLNSEIYAAVLRAGTEFEFVDADANAYGVRVSPFAGHEFCSDDPYFHGVSFPFEYTMHPNELGQAAYAELIKQYLLSHQLV